MTTWVVLPIQLNPEPKVEGDPEIRQHHAKVEETVRENRDLLEPIETDEIDINTVAKAYARWAPVYDLVFGAVFDAGRKAWPIFDKANGVGKVEWVGMDPSLRETMLAKGDIDAITGFYFTSLLNLEARGVRGPAMMFETGHPNAGIVSDWAKNGARPARFSSIQRSACSKNRSVQ